jgi:transcription elongation factor/antiterminator RfaH
MEHEKSRDWYVVYSKRNKEEQAQFHLATKGIESFFPRLSIANGCKSKSRVVPLFPNYLFVRINMAVESHYVIWTPGVHKFVSFSEVPVPVEPTIVGFLQSQADKCGVIRARSQLKCGQEVEITGGPFEGLLGIIQDPPDAKGRVRVLLNLMNRKVAVSLGLDNIGGQWVGIESMSASAWASNSLSAN